VYPCAPCRGRLLQSGERGREQVGVARAPSLQRRQVRRVLLLAVHLVRCVALLELAGHDVVPLPQLLVLLALLLLQQLQRSLLDRRRMVALGSGDRFVI